MDEKKVLDDLHRAFPKKVLETSVPLGDETAVIRKEALFEIADFLRKKPYEYAILLDLTCVD